ncbi:hypothetical protein CHLNCDRAFT_141564 [Chlorella variabilis]|uniref:Enhancer of polycomb-like N-terminal domain-containing protein n=1 Tax=Chlorella variabilis TaxID=554065 RepID=E1ZT49_CHLVA|nr:hypothetical protein CHLNCDRAFT_141564 [Chlorella variabilis]EFN51054.1 hypothetical protein CHLNCDRAFT_141564 [Chlorella variabilis]|eukprot:XP_005843156.1 hypothetical protein CHLNCDRAFT_141564 [Chlorella variabilis]
MSPATAGEPKLPRGSRETAALLRANGYGVLNQEKLRHKHDVPAGAPQQAPPQQQQQQRHVRVMEPPVAQAARRPADKRKHAEPSSSEDERPVRSTRSGGAQQQPHALQGGGMKRVRSSWKMRPLLVDEKLAVFLEGQDDALLHYDGGEFYQWLRDCEAGKADPAEGFPYPLVVQDKDLRTLLEIKQPEQQPAAELRQVVAPAAAGGAADERIIVPTVRMLPATEQPDLLVREQEPPVVQRMLALEQPDVAGTSAAALAASAAWQSAELAVALDLPYIRYVQPTPDDLDLAVEFNLDEDDEEWLAQYNVEAKRAKSRKGRRTLGEEWMEHLIDRMEKEYTAELQRHPGKWVVQAADPSATDQPPNISIPSIDEVFPLEKCLQVPGINHYENVIVAVYDYWKAKHERAGRPLIQRLWYEPPWDRKKAAQRLASNADDGEGGVGEDGPFWAQDSPVALAGIRKRRMDPDEAKARFQEIRRDLESARTLADQIRKREKLKRRELQLYKEEWAARMQAIRDGAERVVVQQGRVKDPPAQLSAVWRMEAAGAGLLPEYSDELDEDHVAVGAPQDAAAQAEERAVRLAQRRLARDVAVVVPLARAPAQQQQQPGRAAAAPASPILSQGGNVRGPPAAPGVRRVRTCIWCNSDEFLMLGCASCPRCFCFKCFQRRPGLGINNWSRAVKDPRYTCVICRGLEVEDAPSANTADVLPAVDAADATSPRRRGQQHARRQAQQQQQQQAADRAELLDDAQQLGVEIPKGLGGAALRSYLLKRQREVEEHGADSSSQEEEADQQQQQQHGHLRGRPPRAVAGAAAHATHGRARRQQRLGASSGSSESGVDEEQRRPKQRKLGGAALASHLRRLEQRRQQRQQQHASDHEQASFGAAEEDGWPYNHIPAPPRKLGGAALKSYIRRQELLLEEPDGSDSEQPATSGQPLTAAEEWPFAHIPPPPRKLGGAALRSYIKRQELLLAEQQGSDAEGGREHQEATSDSEQPSSSHGVAAAADEAWPYTHIPAPPRKLGGAALKSYIRRQEQLLEEQDGGSEPSGSSSGTAEEFGASSSEDEGPATRHGGSSDEERSDHKENLAPPTKRHRALGGAALAAHLRKQSLAAAMSQGRRPGPSAAASGRRASRDAHGLLEQARRLQARRN